MVNIVNLSSIAKKNPKAEVPRYSVTKKCYYEVEKEEVSNEEPRTPPVLTRQPDRLDDTWWWCTPRTDQWNDRNGWPTDAAHPQHAYRADFP